MASCVDGKPAPRTLKAVHGCPVSPDAVAEGGDFIVTQDLEPDRQQVMFPLCVFGGRQHVADG